MFQPSCSVVVCTYNRKDHLRECIEKLLALEYCDYEIIIVDDGSTDGTAEYLKRIESEKVRVVRHSENKGVSSARNSGIKMAKKDIIAFTDDDCRVSSNWLSHLLDPFADGEIMFVIGRTEYIREGYVGYFPERLVKNPFAHWPMVGNMAYRKKVFSEIGFFNEKDFRNVNEDTEMGIRAVVHGFKFARALNAVVFHENAIWSTASLFRSARNASSWVCLAMIYPKHHDFFGSHVKWGFLIEPFDYVLMLFSPLIVPVLFIRYLMHGKRDLGIFFAKWPCYFFLKRYHIYKASISQGRLFL